MLFLGCLAGPGTFPSKFDSFFVFGATQPYKSSKNQPNIFYYRINTATQGTDKTRCSCGSQSSPSNTKGSGRLDQMQKTEGGMGLLYLSSKPSIIV